MKLSEFLRLDREDQFEILANQRDENFLMFLCEKHPEIIYDYTKAFLANRYSGDIVIITGESDMEYYIDEDFVRFLVQDPVMNMVIKYSQRLTPSNMDGKRVKKYQYDMGASRKLRSYNQWQNDIRGKYGIRFAEEFPQDSFELIFANYNKVMNYLEEW